MPWKRGRECGAHLPRREALKGANWAFVANQLMNFKDYKREWDSESLVKRKRRFGAYCWRMCACDCIICLKQGDLLLLYPVYRKNESRRWARIIFIKRFNSFFLKLHFISFRCPLHDYPWLRLFIFLFSSFVVFRVCSISFRCVCLTETLGSRGMTKSSKEWSEKKEWERKGDERKVKWTRKEK